MRIICLVKFIPDVDNFKYNYEKNVLIRENVHMILNPDDACALAYAFHLKKERGAFIEAVTMAPSGVTEQLRDLLRRGVDHATIISDPAYAGSDTYATSVILGRYLQNLEYDLILTGTHSLDGDTAHVPAQIAEQLGLPQLSGVRRVEQCGSSGKQLVCRIENDDIIYRFEVELPAVVGIVKESGYKLPFVRYADLNLDVDDRIETVTNDRLGFEKDEVGLSGSLTKVVATRVPLMENRQRVVAENVDDGVEIVYSLLRDKGFV